MEDAIIKFDENELRHTCITSREGEWVIFKCPICKDYERRMNLRTGEMKSKIGMTNTILHSGMMMPVGLTPSLYSGN